MKRVALSFIHETFGVEFTDVALQYNWITDPATILWIPPLVWRRMLGRSVTVNWAEWKRKWTLNYVYYKCGLYGACKRVVNIMGAITGNLNIGCGKVFIEYSLEYKN